jgi:Skp family chaperone for outer membrane proteins
MIRRTLSMAALVSVAVFVAGCGITAEQRKSLIDEAVIVAGKAAELQGKELLEKGIKAALEEAAKLGLSPEKLVDLEKKLRKEGDEKLALIKLEAEERERQKKEKELPQPGKGGGWFGDLLLALLPIAGQIGLSALGKKGSSP